MEAELFFIWSIFNTCSLLFQNVVGYMHFSCSVKDRDDTISEQFWNDETWSSALLVHPHVPFFIYVQNTKYSKSFMAPEVRMEMEGNKELFCLFALKQLI